MNTQPDAFDESLLSAYLDGELDASQCAHIEQMLQQQALWRHKLHELEVVRSRFASLELPPTPSDLADRIQRRVAVVAHRPHPRSPRLTQSPTPARSMWRRLEWPVAAGVAALLLLAVLNLPQASRLLTAKRDEAVARHGGEPGLPAPSELEVDLSQSRQDRAAQSQAAQDQAAQDQAAQDQAVQVQAEQVQGRVGEGGRQELSDSVADPLSPKPGMAATAAATATPDAASFDLHSSQANGLGGASSVRDHQESVRETADGGPVQEMRRDLFRRPSPEAPQPVAAGKSSDVPAEDWTFSLQVRDGADPTPMLLGKASDQLLVLKVHDGQWVAESNAERMSPETLAFVQAHQVRLIVETGEIALTRHELWRVLNRYGVAETTTEQQSPVDALDRDAVGEKVANKNVPADAVMFTASGPVVSAVLQDLTSHKNDSHLAERGGYPAPSTDELKTSEQIPRSESLIRRLLIVPKATSASTTVTPLPSSSAPPE